MRPWLFVSLTGILSVLSVPLTAAQWLPRPAESVLIDSVNRVLGADPVVRASKIPRSSNATRLEDLGSPAWVRYSGAGNSPGRARATDVVVDSADNVYVTGTSTAPFFGTEIVTIKYDPAGAVMWRRTFDGATAGESVATGIVSRPSGGVFVTGKCRAESGNYEFCTVAYDDAGEELWRAFHTRLAQGSADPYAIAASPDGGVVVAGGGAGSEVTSGTFAGHFDYDFLLVSYGSDGREYWATGFDGSDGSTRDFSPIETATSVVTDSAGSVYVSGPSLSDGVPVMTVVKFDPKGLHEWTARVGRPPTVAEPAGLALANGSMIYVAGSARDTIVGRNTYVAAAHRPSDGGLVWERDLPLNDAVRNEPSDVGTDGNDLFVTGTTFSTVGSGSDFLTASFDSTGQLRWRDTLDHAGMGDQARKLAVHPATGLYVAGDVQSSSGYDYHLVRYDLDGARRWQRSYDGPSGLDEGLAGLDVISDGGAVVTGTSPGAQFDFATVAFDSSGEKRWVARYEPPLSSADHLRGIAADPDGNVVVVALIWSYETAWDISISKYERAGHLVWTHRRERPGFLPEEPIDVLVDTAGNVYVVGQVFSNTYDWDLLAAKYAPDGTELWSTVYDVPGSQRVQGVALDDRNRLIIAATSVYGDIGEFIVLGYETAGAIEIDLKIPRGNEAGVEMGLAISDHGHICLAGIATLADALPTWTVHCLNGDGALVWSAAQGPAQDEPRAIRLGPLPNGGVLVATSTGEAVTSTAYDAEGAVIWENVDVTSAADAGHVRGVVTTDTGDGFVVVGPSSGNNRIAVLKYGSEGETAWRREFDLEARAAITDWEYSASNGLYLAGMIEDVDRPAVLRIWRVSHEGSIVAVADIPNRGDQIGFFEVQPLQHSNIREVALALTGEGDLYAAGTMYGAFGPWRAVALARFDEEVIASAVQPPDVPGLVRVGAPFPNPSPNSFTIPLTVRSTAFVEAAIFDVLGRRLETLLSADVFPGAVKLTWEAQDVGGRPLPPGVYFCRTVSGTSISTVPLVLVR